MSCVPLIYHCPTCGLVTEWIDDLVVWKPDSPSEPDTVTALVAVANLRRDQHLEAHNASQP